jgi:hypothetical protein
MPLAGLVMPVYLAADQKARSNAWKPFPDKKP